MLGGGCSAVKKLPDAEKADFINGVNAFIFDCDGALLGPTPTTARMHTTPCMSTPVHVQLHSVMLQSRRTRGLPLHIAVRLAHTVGCQPPSAAAVKATHKRVQAMSSLCAHLSQLQHSGDGRGVASSEPPALRSPSSTSVLIRPDCDGAQA